MTTPTNAAMRTANELKRLYNANDDSEIPRGDDEFLAWFAELVDRTTALPLLIAACKAAAEHFRDTDAPTGILCCEALKAAGEKP